MGGAGLARLVLQHRELLIKLQGHWVTRVFSKERDHARQRTTRLQLVLGNVELEAHEFYQFRRVPSPDLELLARVAETPNVDQLSDARQPLR